jgi:hypothetical protein
MQPTTALEIKDRLQQYVAGTITLREFQEWFAPLAWDLDDGGDPATEDLINVIQLRLFEFGHGDWSEPELRTRFRDELDMAVIPWPDGAPDNPPYTTDAATSPLATESFTLVLPGSR